VSEEQNKGQAAQGVGANPRTLAVFKWLDAVLDRAERNPLVLKKAKDELEAKKEVVKEAVLDAVIPEFREDVELIAKLLA